MFKFIILFSIFLNTLFANVVINDVKEKYDNFTIKYLYDETATLTIEDIQSTDFRTSIPNQFTQGYRYGNAWFEIEIENTSKKKDFVLYFTESIWSKLNLYTKENSHWNIQKNGLDVALKNRKIQDSSPAFELKLKPGEKTTLYVEGRTIASQIGEFQLYTHDAYYNPNRKTLSECYTIYVFVLLAFILLNFYNFIATKESIYAYYMAYVLIYIIFAAMHSGIYINFGFPNWNEGLHVLGSLTLFTLLQFSKEFLSLETTYPLMKKVFNYLSLIALLFAFLLSQNLPYATVASNIFFSATLIGIVYVAVQVLRGGFDGAKYYLLALMLYLPSMAIMAMNFNAILPNTDFTRYSFLGGAFVEIFLFTLILTNRYMDINHEKVLIQEALIKEKSNNEKKLVSEIKKKTKHLTQTNQQLIEKTNQLEKAKEQLTKEAKTDMLSGLYNRRYFFEALQLSFYTAMRYEQELSILMIDIDNFKTINDNYGHLLGDQVIRKIAHILKAEIRTSDIVARYGGEEFIVLLPRSTQKESLNLAQRIRQEVEKLQIITESEETISVTISLGLSQLENDHDTDIEQLILRADKALYDAKESGRNKVCIL